MQTPVAMLTLLECVALVSASALASALILAAALAVIPAATVRALALAQVVRATEKSEQLGVATAVAALLPRPMQRDHIGSA